MKTNIENIISKDNKYLFQNYGNRLPVEFKKGKKCFLYDQDGRQYIDFFAGIAVCTLGYNNPTLMKGLKKQMNSILHTSNWFFNSNQTAAAKLISENSFDGKTLFVNSGTEANEAAIKLARKYGISKDPEKYHIISFSGSFHGRTFGAMSATAQEKIHNGFGPLVPGFTYLPFNDIEAFSNEVKSGKYCGVIFECVQGEGGIRPVDKLFIEEVYSICRQNDILLIADEVQTGIGRTGKVFAYRNYGITPDLLTLAKGLGAGLPIGALHASDELSKVLSQGTHGTTFGGNHLACKAAEIVLETISKKEFLDDVMKMSGLFFSELNKMKEEISLIKNVRGIGLHIGVELDREGLDIVKQALKKGLIINCTAGNVIRLVPPLNIDKKTALKGLETFKELLKEQQNEN